MMASSANWFSRNVVQMNCGGKMIEAGAFYDAGEFTHAEGNVINGLIPLYNDFVCYLIKNKMMRLETDDLAF